MLALRSLAKSLGTVPGRKTLVLLTSGFPMTPELQSELTAVIATCNRYNVAVYPLDVRGLVAGHHCRTAIAACDLHRDPGPVIEVCDSDLHGKCGPRSIRSSSPILIPDSAAVAEVGRWGRRSGGTAGMVEDGGGGGGRRTGGGGRAVAPAVVPAVEVVLAPAEAWGAISPSQMYGTPQYHQPRLIVPEHSERFRQPADSLSTGRRYGRVCHRQFQ